MTNMSTPELSTWQHAEESASRGRFDEARSGYETLARHADWRVLACLRLSHLAAHQGRLRHAVDAIVRAATGTQDEAALAAAVVKQCFDVGEIQAGLTVANARVLQDAVEPELLRDVARSLCDQAYPDHALPLLERAAALGDRSAALFFLLGLARLYAGDVTAAEASFEQCIRLQPANAAAHHTLAGARRQTADHHHLVRLRDQIGRFPGSHPNSPLLHYALFKELDDLGDHRAAWSALLAGMESRRAQLPWTPGRDQALFEALHAVRRAADADAADQPAGACPIFVVGLPRSGTTLLERMLGGHPQVTDAGELRDFAWQARYVTDRMGPPETDLPLAEALHAYADWAELGRRYLAHAQWRANDRPFFTDKLPINYLNVGWIAKSLPHARILHMVREPMDVCFSNLKQLFAPSNEHSFDMREMADHYVQYRQLMAHWHREFPGRILDVDYRDLVSAPETTARSVLDFCGLAWAPQVLAVEDRQGTVATASSVQVREAVHTRFLGHWQRYAAELEPMRRRLADSGW